jgi:hypothetical protein
VPGQIDDGGVTMPTDEERCEYPHLTDEEWAGAEMMRAAKARGEFPFHTVERVPDFEDQVLEQLREQTALLREIRDMLAAGEGV